MRIRRRPQASDPSLHLHAPPPPPPPTTTTTSDDHEKPHGSLHPGLDLPTNPHHGCTIHPPAPNLAAHTLNPNHFKVLREEEGVVKDSTRIWDAQVITSKSSGAQCDGNEVEMAEEKALVRERKAKAKATPTLKNAIPIDHNATTKRCGDEATNTSSGSSHSNNAKASKEEDKVNAPNGNVKGKKRKSPAVLMEGSRCSRVNGRGWRCCQQTLVGYSLCEHHLGKGRLRSMNSVRGQLGSTKPVKPIDPNATSAAPSAPSSASPPKEQCKKIGIVKARSINSLLTPPPPAQASPPTAS